MKHLIALLSLVIIGINHSIAQNWVSVAGQNKKNLVYDSQSIDVYPGMVVFNTRYEIPKSELFYFHKLAYLCGSKEVHGIASTLNTEKKLIPHMTSEIMDKGVVEHMAIPGLVNQISKFCGTRVSRNNLEMPISVSNDLVSFVLPKETVINGFRVVMWHKNYSYIKEPLMVNGEEYKVDGEVIFNKKILRNIGYQLYAWEYDCSSKTSAVLTTVDYDLHGNVKNTYDFSSRKNFSTVVPGSVGKTNLDFACGLR